MWFLISLSNKTSFKEADYFMLETVQPVTTTIDYSNLSKLYKAHLKQNSPFWKPKYLLNATNEYRVV